MNGAAAGLVAVTQHPVDARTRVGIRAPRYWVMVGQRSQIEALEVAQLIVRLEIRSLQARAAFEADHFHPNFCELGGDDAPRRAGADDNNVCFFGCHETAP